MAIRKKKDKDREELEAQERQRVKKLANEKFQAGEAALSEAKFEEADKLFSAAILCLRERAPTNISSAELLLAIRWR